MPRAPKATTSADSTAHLGFEAKLWLAADKLHKNNPRSVDLLGRVYEHFLTRFARAEGKNGGQFYTSSCAVRCLVEPVPVRKDLAPYKGRLYDPACGSGPAAAGFVQSDKFVESHGGVAKCEVRSASVKVKKSRSFDIQKSAFGISPARRLSLN